MVRKPSCPPLAPPFIQDKVRLLNEVHTRKKSRNSRLRVGQPVTTGQEGSKDVCLWAELAIRQRRTKVARWTTGAGGWDVWSAAVGS